MKRIIILIGFLVLNINCKAQNNTIISGEITINGHGVFGNDVTLLVQYFGQPNSIEDYYYEMRELTAKKYIYNGILFYIVNERFDSFEITGSSHTFTVHNVKVGESIEKLQSIYPLSYANKSNGGLMLPLEDMDLFIVISFNTTNNLIKKIALYSY